MKEIRSRSTNKAGKPATRRSSFDTRMQLIYAKATQLFAQNGYLNTTMNDIADAVNLRKGGLYHYIENKEMLLFTILDQALDAFLKQAESQPTDRLPIRKKLERLIHDYTLSLVQYHNEVTLIVLASKYLQPERQKIIQSKRLKYESFFYSIIAEGFSEKLFQKHADKETLGFLILGGIFNYYLWHPKELQGDVSKKVDAFVKFYLNGLLAR